MTGRFSFLAVTLLALAPGLSSPCRAEQPYYDRSHPSKVFGEQRKYRVFLPPHYGEPDKHYPVIYYFHGHSDRYTLEQYDSGLDTVPKITAFVANHDVIVVAADGYVARDYTGFYGGFPYDVRRDGGDFDYGEYFLELVRHIDSTYRTLSSRRYRATAGLSMGGFMSLYLSARYPDQIGSASAFNPAPECYVGEKGRRSLWRPKDHVSNHERTMIRLIHASGDFISQYHEETREAYAISPAVDFEYRQDDFNRHWATSIGETFEFHMRAFANPALDTVHAEWNYSTAFRNFGVWDYRVEMESSSPAVLYLEHVTQGGLRLRSRKWAPDGPAAACASVNLTTAPLYRPGETYRIFDYPAIATGKTSMREAVAGENGRLALRSDCAGHEIGIEGPGTGAQAPVLLPLTVSDTLRLRAGEEIALPVRIFNPRGTALKDVHAELSSAYPTVKVLSGKAQWPEISPASMTEPGPPFRIRLTAADGYFAHARLDLKLVFDDYHEAAQLIDILIVPEKLPEPAEIAILDGRAKTFPVFRQKGNQGGGDVVDRAVTEGVGNGNGVLERGEQASIWVKLPQGLDPFDKGTWHRAKIYANSSWLAEIADVQEDKEREWTGAQNRTSLVELSARTPADIEIPVILDCESWSFHYTPDVRYGKETLYQGFQFHRHQLFAWKWKANYSSTNQ